MPRDEPRITIEEFTIAYLINKISKAVIQSNINKTSHQQCKAQIKKSV